MFFPASVFFFFFLFLSFSLLSLPLTRYSHVGVTRCCSKLPPHAMIQSPHSILEWQDSRVFPRARFHALSCVRVFSFFLSFHARSRSLIPHGGGAFFLLFIFISHPLP
ncbi:hypothetical protein F5148DRAFT_1179483 [Russula earlei]|uniref:Uncharacterized protein n=1 Tax=Russula earlei TaxID=71964 RepID=A0ACC0UFE3_9AGAM|nr:hypothetical protein F5148DRAFT_1179483 [Russula earlei]